MMGSAMVTMAIELFCLNKLLKSLRYFHVVFLSVVLPVKIFNLTIRDTNPNTVKILTIFYNVHFFSKK
jgi:uncharacterized membrane protein (DUF2068 family)